MSWTRRDVLTLGSLALAGAALGPSGVFAQAPKRGGTLTIRGWDPPLFDPMLTTAYRVHVPLSLTQSRLSCGTARAPRSSGSGVAGTLYGSRDIDAAVGDR